MSFELSKSLGQTPAPRPVLPLLPMLQEWLAVQAFKLQIWQERRDLAALPPHLLKDIGVDPIDARRESRRSLGDMPECRSIPLAGKSITPV